MKLVAATVLIAVFLGAVPAAAAERPGREAVAQAGPLAQVRLWLGGLLAAWGLGPLTSAGGWASSSGDEGLIIDPDGFRLHRRDQTARSGIQAIENDESRTSGSGR